MLPAGSRKAAQASFPIIYLWTKGGYLQPSKSREGKSKGTRIIGGQLFAGVELYFIHIISFLIYCNPISRYYCTHFADQSTEVQRGQKMWAHRIKLIFIADTNIFFLERKCLYLLRYLYKHFGWEVRPEGQEPQLGHKAEAQLPSVG